MKKSIFFLPILLVSCQSNTYPFRFEDKYYTTENKGFIDIDDISIIDNLENSKESFGVYIYLPGCLTCNKFKPILTNFLEINNLQIYSISYTDVKKTKNTLHSNIEYTPSVALFNKGELVTYLDALSNEHIKYYESLDDFTNWFTTYVDISFSK